MIIIKSQTQVMIQKLHFWVTISRKVQVVKCSDNAQGNCFTTTSETTISFLKR